MKKWKSLERVGLTLISWAKKMAGRVESSALVDCQVWVSW